jgi:hypothetical protein
MVRTALAMVLGLGMLAAGPLASTARAETPRQAWLENHPYAAARIWDENHPYRSGLLPYVPPADRVVVEPVAPVVVDPVAPVVVDPVIRVYRPWRWYR